MSEVTFETVGKVVDNIPVKISYRIIELFSAGLYSSPNKAFEELVSNSYDAGATQVCIRVDVKGDQKFKESILWVCDNGEGMSLEGLKQFWKIGSSNKYRSDVEKKAKHNRLAIGKFGIGKLATYILTEKLTLISKTAQGFYAVTMNYGNVSKDVNEGEESELKLDERSLTLDQVKSVLQPLIYHGKESLLTFDLWGKGAESSWTFAIMSDLKTKSKEIHEGRLKFVLRTALPLNPNFNMMFNGERLNSSKDSIKPMKVWVFGKDDQVVKKNREYQASNYNGKPSVNMDAIKNVTGQIELFKESFLKGDKAEKWGRSHGIFLMVRERLINIDDALIGVGPLSHGVFNRVRIMVYADELDSLITSTRESIVDSPALDQIRKYIGRKFTEVKDYYFSSLHDEETKNKALYKVSQSQSSLSRLPILNGIRKYVDGKITSFYNTRVPSDLTKDQKHKLIGELENDLMTESGIIKNIAWESLGIEEPIAILDFTDSKLKVNLLHPFFSNFVDEANSHMPFELIAVSEVLHEYHLHESGIDEETVIAIMEKRDDTFRDLTYSDKPSAPLVAMMLKASLKDPSALEANLVNAFASLGFETRRIGGKGKPDGVAMARIGPQKSTDRYTVTFDAKSTTKNTIKAITTHISGVKRHQHDYKADYSCVVSIGFEGAVDPESAVNKEAKSNKVTLITADDLCALVTLAGPKQLSLKRLRDLFENCHTTIETSKWVEDFRNQQVAQGPIKELLETIYELYDDDSEPATLSALRQRNPKLKALSLSEIRALVQSLANLVPHYIGLNGDVVSINVGPDQIMKKLRSVVSEVPLDVRSEYTKAYLTKSKVQAQKKAAKK